MKKKFLLILLFLSTNALQANAPQNFETEFNCGIDSFRQGNYTQALDHLKKAVEFDPTQAQTYYNIGLIYLARQDYAQACASFEQATKYKPDYTKAYNFKAQACQKLEKLDDAIACYQKMLELGAAPADTYSSIGRIQRSQNKFDAAIESYKKALEFDSRNIVTLFDIAYIHTFQGAYEAAIPYYEKLLSINPDITDAACNFAHTLKYLGRINSAETYYKQVLTKWPEFAHAHYGLAECALSLGDFETGWKSFEWRWKRDDNSRNFKKKLWDGSNVSGKTIMLRAEYGQGDTMQFIRYAQLLKEQGATVILEAQHTLITLLSRCPYLDAVIPVVDTVEQLPYFDFQVPVMSLPYYFHTTLQTVPNNIPYIQAAPELVEYWKEKLNHDPVVAKGYDGQGTNFKIGICWGTSPYYEQFKSALSKKAVTLTSFYCLSQIPGVTLYSLQKMDGLDQLNALPAGMTVHDFGSDFDNNHGRFMDTAAVIENIDLVVTVDTSVTHLAGALGKPVFVLLPKVADWRWMLDRNDPSIDPKGRTQDDAEKNKYFTDISGNKRDVATHTPWYPHMRLFRQKNVGDWDSVLSEVCQEVAKILELRATKRSKLAQSPSTTLDGNLKPETISVMAEVQIGELIDKITILQIKMDNIKDAAKLVNIKAELETLLATCNRDVPQSLKLKTLWQELLEVNKKLWDIEDDIRDKERAREFDNAFIKYARSVYYTNDERCRIKRELNMLAGSRLIEEKSYTDYTISMKK